MKDVPTPNSQPVGITVGPDGAMWICEYLGNKLARMTTEGVVTNEYPVPTPDAQPHGIVWGLGYRFTADRSYTIRFDGERWSRQRGEAVADVVVETSPEGWVAFLAADRAGRRRWLRESGAEGRPERIEELASAFGPGP